MQRAKTLTEYIERVGVFNLSQKLGCRQQNVNQWKLLQHAPRPAYAYKLIKVSKGELTLNAIYLPFIKKNKHKWS